MEARRETKRLIRHPETARQVVRQQHNREEKQRESQRGRQPEAIRRRLSNSKGGKADGQKGRNQYTSVNEKPANQAGKGTPSDTEEKEWAEYTETGRNTAECCKNSHIQGDKWKRIQERQKINEKGNKYGNNMKQPDDGC